MAGKKSRHVAALKKAVLKVLCCTILQHSPLITKYKLLALHIVSINESNRMKIHSSTTIQVASRLNLVLEGTVLLLNRYLVPEGYYCVPVPVTAEFRVQNWIAGCGATHYLSRIPHTAVFEFCKNVMQNWIELQNSSLEAGRR